MNVQSYNINLRVGTGITQNVKLSQGDIGRKLVFYLYDGAVRFSPPSGASVKIKGIKPSGLGFDVACTLSGSVARVSTTLAMTQEGGNIPAELEISNGSAVIGTANFVMYVEPSPHPAGTTDGTTEEARTVLAQCAQYAQEAQEAAEEASGDYTEIRSDVDALSVDVDQLKDDLGDLEDRVEALEEGGSGGGSGVPASVKSAIASLFHAIPYTDDMSTEIAVIDSWASEISGISVSPTTASVSGASTTQLVATTTPAGGIVTWESSNTAVATVSNSGLVTGIGNGQATITARCGGYSATCAVTVSGFATLTGITAAYSGGSVTDSTTLNDLKTNLVVTASYDNGTTATVTDYTLSGSLAVGTNTIMVSYGGFTDSFTVTMTSDLLYKWDLTKSLTDEVSGQVAVASAGSGVDAPAITSNGLVFNAATQMLLLGNIWLTNKTIEIDVVSMDFKGSNDAHIRFLCTMLATGTTGIGSIVYHKTEGWKAYVRTTGTAPAWTNVWTSNNNKNLFDGKTVKLVSGDSDTKLFLNDELIGTLPHFTYEYGSYQPALSIGGCASYSQAAGDQCYDMTISGVRIRSNPTEEVSE